MSAPPVRFDPGLEHIAADEAETQASIVATLRGIAETTLRDYSHAVRSVHAKSYALLEGEMTVEALPDELAQGAFAVPGTYPVVLRFSTNPGDILHDAVSVPRGLAVKMIGVKGARLPGPANAVTQDFVLVNGPAFVAPDAKAFLRSLKLLAATTDRGEAAKVVLSTALRGVNSALKAVGHESPTLGALGGQPLTHPLGETFYSQTPLRWGEYVAKVSAAPVSANLVALKDQPLALHGNPNALRQAAIDALAHEDAEWEVRVQLCTDLDTMPVEDATVAWPEDASPFRTIACIRVKAQPAWSEARAARVDDRLAFSPWHGLVDHQPLGSINRARRPAYAELSAVRAAQVGGAIKEPREAVGLSDAPASAVGTAPGREGFRNAPRPPRPGLGGRAVAGALGGLAGGLLVSAILLAKQALTGRQSDLAELEQNASGRWGSAGPGGEAAVQGGHLALSALSGAAFGVLKPDGVAPSAAGLVFGLGFGAVAYGAAGPALGATPPPWRDTGANNVQHLLVHALFGLATALVADRLDRRLAQPKAARRRRRR